MKIACVIHRFGADIAGGSEAHCRHVAERLAAHHDVTILTTCAKDHVTWRNEYPAGESRLGALRVAALSRSSATALAAPLPRHQRSRVQPAAPPRPSRNEWFRENGPEAPELLSYLAAHGREFDTVLFWAFRYAVVFFGLPLVADRAMLVPTAEDDPVIGMEIVGRFLSRPVGYIFLTPEEQELVERRMSGPLPPSCVIGSGLEPAGSSASPQRSRRPA